MSALLFSYAIAWDEDASLMEGSLHQVVYTRWLLFMLTPGDGGGGTATIFGRIRASPFTFSDGEP